MKKLLIAAAMLGLVSCAGLFAQSADTVDARKYLMIEADPSALWTYVIGKETFTDRFIDQTKLIRGLRYHVRIREYSTGGRDTTYYRMGEDGIYHISLLSAEQVESLSMPVVAYTGKRWFEADSSWVYEVKGVDESLETPTGTYDGLLHITTRQRFVDPEKGSVEYGLYFAKGIGLIAGTTAGRTIVYLTEFDRGKKSK